MKNLLVETIEFLNENKRGIEDVEWCGSETFGWFSFEDFVEIANVKYDPGFGGQEVAVDLKIVGKDFWLERHQYDGSEWWEYKEIPKKPEKYNKAQRVIYGCHWETLEEMHQPGGEYGVQDEKLSV